MPFELIGTTIKKGKWRRSPAKIALTNWSVEKALDEVLKNALPSLTDRIRLASYKEGRLVLKTPSPSISQEVYLHSKKIADKLNEFFERKVVEKIRFKLT